MEEAVSLTEIGSTSSGKEATRQVYRSNGGKASKGSNRRKEEWKDGSGKEKRKQGVKKMDTGDGKELTDKDEKEKELKVRMIRARKTGGTHWSGGGSMTSGRKEGRGDE